RRPDPHHAARPPRRGRDTQDAHDAGGGRDHDRRDPGRARAGADDRGERVVTLRWGLLSTALINDRIIHAARSTSRADVVAVASRDAERAAAYARERGIERAHESYEALLEDPGVDAVYISLPNGMHVEWTLRALEAGKHVLVEKPFSARVESVVQSFDAADARGLTVSEGFMWRHQPQTAELIRLVRDGAIGRLRLSPPA